MSNPITILSTNGGLTIIDGVSDVFKIAATGLLITSGSGTGQANATATVNNPFGINIPICLIFNQGTGLANANVAQCPVLILSSSGAVAWSYTGWVEATADPTKLLIVTQTTATTAGAGGMGSYYRYYLLAETGT